MTHRRAFTLIEMVLVVALLSLTSAAVVWNLTGSSQAAQLERAIGHIAHVDQVARGHALAFDRETVLKFETGSGRVNWSVAGDDPGPGAHRMDLPGGCVVRAIRTKSEGIESGEASVRFSKDGVCPTYALLVAGASQRQWIIVTGLTGHCRAVTENECEKLMDMSVSARPDAD